MLVTLIAATELVSIPDSVAASPFNLDIEPSWNNAGHNEHADRLAHFAGRSCYQAWELPRKETANDEGYLANIIKQGHFSVLEHAHATFYIEGASRALLTELTRHRHASFSVESQRYVDYSGTQPVIPPVMRGTELEDDLRNEYARALTTYSSYVNVLMAQGHSRKEAREAARSVLPNCAPVAMVVSGNHRAFRDMLQKRYSIHADAEIRELSIILLTKLREIAPATYQDFPNEPFGN